MIRIARVPIAIILAVTLAGCSGHFGVPPATGSVTSETGATSVLPEWVRTVHPTSGGRDIYVGGCSMASGPAQSVELAGADAYSQITERARRIFTKVFTGAIQTSDIELTSIDRLDFREKGLELYADQLIETARPERVYFQDCERGLTYDELPDHWTGGPVCRTFAEFSLDVSVWERMLTETILDMRHGYARDGRGNLVELADWVVANLETPERALHAKPDVR